MVDLSPKQLLLDGICDLLGQQAEAHAAEMGSLCPGRAADTMAGVSSAFRALPRPADDEDLAFRFKQFTCACAMIGSVAQAFSVAMIWPAAADDVLNEAQQHCDAGLPMSVSGLIAARERTMQFLTSLLVRRGKQS